MEQNTEKYIDNEIDYSKLKDILSADILDEYNYRWYNNLSSKQLDKEFRSDINSLTKALENMSQHKKQFIRDIISDYLEIYVTKKIEAELESSFNNALFGGFGFGKTIKDN